jgi:DNA recombination-dependent growth factor C
MGRKLKKVLKLAVNWKEEIGIVLKRSARIA